MIKVIERDLKKEYYNEIKNKIIDNEIYERVKDYSKEKHRVLTYFEIGKILNEAGKHYGDGIVKEYSFKLIKEVNKKYNERTLRRMRQFYKKFHAEKWSTMSTKISWSHYTELLPITDKNEMLYYYNICINQNIDVRSLREKIRNHEYNRLSSVSRNKLINNDRAEIKDFIPNPILIKNRNNLEIVTEKALHRLILEDIPSFLKELGKGFSFIDSEYRIKIGERYNYIDLLLFNIKYNAYVVVELKVREFKAEYISQVKKYMNYIDKNIKEVSNNNTIGILICKRENKFVIEYCSDDRIMIREYKLV